MFYIATNLIKIIHKTPPFGSKKIVFAKQFIILSNEAKKKLGKIFQALLIETAPTISF